MRLKQNSLLFGTALLLTFALQAFALDEPDAGDAPRGIHQSSPAQDTASTNESASGNTELVRIERFEVKGNTLLDPGLIERL